MESRGVLFTGDSLGQVMFDVIQHRLGGGNLGVRDAEKVAKKSGRVGNLRLVSLPFQDVGSRCDLTTALIS